MFKNNSPLIYEMHFSHFKNWLTSMYLDINRNEKVQWYKKTSNVLSSIFKLYLWVWTWAKILNKIIKRAQQYIINKPNYNFIALSLIHLLSCKYTSQKLTIINAWYLYSKDCTEINYMVCLTQGLLLLLIYWWN